MILEAIEWLITPCPPWARRMGYLSESIAIRHRARRCAAHWAAHQANTRNAILRAAASTPKRDHILVLGAGACLDVPLADLAEMFTTVTLVDAVRPRAVRLPSNVRYHVTDVHGAAEGLSGTRDNRRAPLAELDAADLTVSVNLLSQLPRLPIRAMRRRGLLDEAAAETLTRRIMVEHLHDLSSRDGLSVLIADAEQRLLDGHGTVLEARDIAAVAGLPSPSETWVWPVAPPGERTDGRREESTVGVWHL